MICFPRNRQSPFFNLFLHLEQDPAGKIAVKVIFPENPPRIDPALGKFCFPTDVQARSQASDEKFTFCLTGADSLPTYGYVYHKFSQSRQAFCIISSFYDPQQFGSIIDMCCNSQSDKISILHRFITPSIPSNPFAAEDSILRFHLSSLFGLLDPYFVAVLAISILIDCRIILCSSSLEKLSQFSYSLLSIIHPLPWPGVFIPILPSNLIDTLLAPFPFIVGLHSSLAPHIHTPDIESHLVFNIDSPLLATIRTIEFPDAVHQKISSFSKSVKLPGADIMRQTKDLLLDVLAMTLNASPMNPTELYNQWSKMREKTDLEEFANGVCSSQVVMHLMREVEQGPSSAVFCSYWPSLAGKAPVEKVLAPSPLKVSNNDIEVMSRLADSFNSRKVSIDDMLRQKKAERVVSTFHENPEKLQFKSKLAIFENASTPSFNLPKKEAPRVRPVNARAAERAKTLNIPTSLKGK